MDESVDTSSQPPQNVRQYVMVLYSRGDVTLDEAESRVIFAGHMRFLNAQGALGRNVLSGPFGDDGVLRGISIYDTTSVAEVEELVATDPAVVSGSMVAEVRPWWGVTGSVLPD